MESNGELDRNVKIPAALYQQKISYLWNIKTGMQNLNDLEKGEYITSSRFYTNDAILKSDWKLRLYPSGQR